MQVLYVCETQGTKEKTRKDESETIFELITRSQEKTQQDEN
jgi:hypothetical protein